MKKITLILGLVLWAVVSTYAQCCSAGNPVDSDMNRGVVGKKSLIVGLSYKQSYSDTYYEGNSISDYKYIDESGFQFSSLNLTYGLTPRLTLKGEMGYFFSKSQTFNVGNYQRKAFGLADAEVGLKYTAYQNENHDLQIAGAFNLKIPIGVFDQVYNNVKLPIDIQPSSGSFRYHAGILIYKSFLENRFSIFSYNAIEIAQRIQSERHPDYKYGNLYMFSLAGSYKLMKQLSVSMQLRNEIREKAADKGKVLNSTGGSVWFVAPELSYMFFNTWTASANINLPVLKNMNGIQLTNKYAIGFSIRKNIHF